MIRGILFLSCLSVVNFNLHYNFWTVKDRDFIFGMHTQYSTNDTLSNNTKVNELVTLTLTFVPKIAFYDFVAPGGIVFHKHMYFFSSAARALQCTPFSPPSIWLSPGMPTWPVHCPTIYTSVAPWATSASRFSLSWLRGWSCYSCSWWPLFTLLSWKSRIRAFWDCLISIIGNLIKISMNLSYVIIEEKNVACHKLYFLSKRNALRRGYSNAAVVPSVCPCVHHALTLWTR